MALKLAGEEGTPTLEKIGSISYNPGLQNTGDLEAGTHTIVPTSRPAIADAQYSASLTLAKPSDAGLIVKRIATRLSVNIAGLGTATHVYCSVRVDVDDVDHELFSKDWTSTGVKLDAVDTHSGAKSTIFDLLKDGAAHTLYFLFWADVASQATIDVVQLWEAVGTCSTSDVVVLDIDFKGMFSLWAYQHNPGTGTPVIVLAPPTYSWASWISTSGAGGQLKVLSFISGGSDRINMKGSVATDLNYVNTITMNLRSEQ